MIRDSTECISAIMGRGREREKETERNSRAFVCYDAIKFNFYVSNCIQIKFAWKLQWE